MMTTKQLRRDALWAFLAMITMEAARIFCMARLQTSEMVQRIPDDAFYYLVLAKNLAQQGHWTFDGASPASGFHPLWGYLLALVAKVLPHAGFHTMFVICSAIAACFLSLAAGLMVAGCQTVFGRRSAWGAVLVLFSGLVLMQSTWLMEAPLALFFAAACSFQVLQTEDRPLTLRRSLLCILLGLLGTLSRSDFGLLPFWLSITFLLVMKMGSVTSTRFRIAALQLAGAAAGVGVVVLHTFWISHRYTQASAQVKLLWGQNMPKSFWGPWQIAANTFNPFFNYYSNLLSYHGIGAWGFRIGRILFIAVIFGAVFLIIRTYSSLQRWLSIGMLATLGSYFLVYRLDGAVQDWYVSQLAVPMCILCAAAWSVLPRRLNLPFAVIAIGMALIGSLWTVRPHATWQEATYRTGMSLRQHPEWRPMGTWNSGVMSYFAGGNVVNLDGLVNDDLLPYIQHKRLAAYFLDRHVEYFVESPSILEGILARRSGIGDGVLAGCIDRRRVLFPNDPLDNAYQSHLELFHVNLECLQTTMR